MKKVLLLACLTLVGCSKYDLAPDTLIVEERLDSVLKQLLEVAIEGEACEKIEAEGFDCRVPEQVKSVYFEWRHDEEGRPVDYELKFCLKDDCPVEPTE